MPRQYGITAFQLPPAAPGALTGGTYYDSPKDLAYVCNNAGGWIPIAADYIASRGPGLVTNGSALLGNNYNFAAYYNLTKTDHPTGAAGSFEPKSQAATSGYCDEFIAVDPAGTYDMTFAYRQVAGDGARRFYSFLAPYDVDKFNIQPYHYMEQAGTRTTLAQTLAPGNTTVVLTSAANWNNSAASPTYDYLRSFIVWAYIDNQGFAWPPGTYSRFWYTNAYPVGGISGNTITLSAPWSGPTFPAGTVIGNGSSGGAFMYGAANVLGPAAWTSYGPYRYSGIHTNLAVSASSAFPAGTSFVKVGFLHNYQPPNDPTAIARVANVNLVGVPTTSGSAGGDLSGTYPNPTIAAGTIVDGDISASAAIAQSKISGLSTSLSGKVDTTRRVNAGTGLTGGGALSADVTLAASLDAAGWDATWQAALGTANTSQLPVFADTLGVLRVPGDLADGGITNRMASDGLDKYVSGVSLLALSGAAATAGSWPGAGSVLTTKRNSTQGTQLWMSLPTVASGIPPWIQYRFNDNTGWSPWVDIYHDTGWVNLTPASGTGILAYRYLNGQVGVKGNLSGMTSLAAGGAGAVSAAGAIPAAYRPSTSVYAMGNGGGAIVTQPNVGTDGSLNQWNTSTTNAITVFRANFTYMLG